MLKTIAVSGNKKTGPIAVTYRSGMHQTYATCPKTCNLHPRSETGAADIDQEYLDAIYNAVPRKGKAWTYSHFHFSKLPKPQANKTVINASCDTIEDAIEAANAGHPAVYAAPQGTEDKWPAKINNVKLLRCPAELSDDFDCNRCGDGEPLCARGDRTFVVVFVAHGIGAKRVGTDKAGGCYAANGPTAIHWANSKKKNDGNDSKNILEFAKSLPMGSYLRHHVAGDIGLDHSKV